jgi:hypothetical protein
MIAPTGSMGLIVVGAAGRMGQALIRTIAEIDGVHLAGAIERPGSDVLGKDAGELSGLGPNGVIITDDALPVFAKAEGVLDFTAPQATLEFADLAAQARIVHVIGTTGMDESHEARLHAASRHARIVKSGNMSLGVNLLSVLVRQAAKALNAGRLGHRGAGNASPPQGRRPVRHGASAWRGGGRRTRDYPERELGQGPRRPYRAAPTRLASDLPPCEAVR